MFRLFRFSLKRTTVGRSHIYGKMFPVALCQLLTRVGSLPLANEMKGDVGMSSHEKEGNKKMPKRESHS